MNRQFDAAPIPSPFTWPTGHTAGDDQMSVGASVAIVTAVTLLACGAIALYAFLTGR